MSRPVREYTPPRDHAHHKWRTSQVERRAGGDWIYVGETLDPSTGDLYADFESPWTNMGGDWQPLRFRWLVDGNVEIEGVVTGGTAGSVIFVLPGTSGTPGSYRRGRTVGEKDLPVAGVNIADFSHAAFKIATNGEVSFEA